MSPDEMSQDEIKKILEEESKQLSQYKVVARVLVCYHSLPSFVFWLPLLSVVIRLHRALLVCYSRLACTRFVRFFIAEPF